MKKKLTESQFQSAIKRLEVGEKTIEIAHGVLVKGKPQTEFVTLFGITKGAVNQAVKRVWDAHKAFTPEGYEQVTAILPEHQAFIVKKWAEDSKKKRDTQ